MATTQDEQSSSSGAISLAPPHTNYIDEIKNLLQLYEEQHNTSFKAFKEVWKALNFSAAHHHVTGDKADYIHSLYYTFIGYLFIPNPPEAIKFGVLYGLYLLYNTQLNQPKVKIIVTLPLWQAILSVDRTARDVRNADSYHVLKKMMAEGNFLFSAALHPASLHTYIPAYSDFSNLPTAIDASIADVNEEDEFEKHIVRGDQREADQDLVKGVIDVDKIDKMAKSYYVAKVQPISVAAALAIDLSQLPLPPPSLNFVHANLGDDLRVVLAEYEQTRTEQLFAPTLLNTASSSTMEYSTNGLQLSFTQTPPISQQHLAPQASSHSGTARSAPAPASASTLTSSATTEPPLSRRRRRRLIQDDVDEESENTSVTISEKPARRKSKQ